MLGGSLLAAGSVHAGPGPDPRLAGALGFVAPAPAAAHRAAVASQDDTDSPLRLSASRNLLGSPVLPPLPGVAAPEPAPVSVPVGGTPPLALRAPAPPPTPADVAGSERPRGGGEGREEEPKGVGLALELGIESAHVARGMNAFQSSSQMDQTPVLVPKVTWEIGESGFSVEYEGVYQLAGDNQADLVKEGVGNEQNLRLFYERELVGPLSMRAGVQYTFFPFADPAVAGTSVPSVLVPIVAVGVETLVDVELELSYEAGLQDAIAEDSRFIIHPSVSRSFEITPDDSLEAAIGGGWKFFRNPAETDNQADVQVDLGFDRKIGRRLHAMPAVHWAWTNRDDVPFSQEHCVWVSLQGGVDL